MIISTSYAIIKEEETFYKLLDLCINHEKEYKEISKLIIDKYEELNSK